MKTIEFTEGIYADLTRQVIGCAIEVHWTLGPGPLEATYEQCLFLCCIGLLKILNDINIS
jgi:hypothetical protein